MDTLEWLTSSIGYGERVLNSGLEGARSGREAFLHGRSLTAFLSESVHQAWKPAVVGACIGVLGSIPGNRNRTIGKVLESGFVGGAVGFGVGIAWRSRRLTESITSSALRSIGKVRDEHWLQSHPIDYA